MNNQISTFQLFRYQILPIDRYYQHDLFYQFNSLEELLERKNDFFSETLKSQTDFSKKRQRIAAKLLVNQGDFFLYRIAQNKKILRETPDFTNETIDTWPSLLVAVWNRQDKQLIAVQKRTTAFGNCEAVVKLILDKLSASLSNLNLRTIYEPLFEKEHFWTLLEIFAGKIRYVDFEIITPNMANISKSLPDDLKAFAKATNSTRNHLKIEADPKSNLHLTPENEALSGLVDYSSDGGGNITLKIDGIKKKHQTSRSVKEVNISTVEMTGGVEQVIASLKELMK